MKCYAIMLNEYKVFLSNNFIGTKLSELSDVSLLLLAIADHAGAVEEIGALPIVEGFLVSISSAYCKHQTSASNIHTISPNFQIQTFDQTLPQNLHL